jgi:hypothetical protein
VLAKENKRNPRLKKESKCSEEKESRGIKGKVRKKAKK